MDAFLPPRQAAQMKTLLQFNATSSGRDKVFRLVQAATNLYVWNLHSKLDKTHRQQLETLSKSLGTTRSFLKLGNFLNSFDGALKALRIDDSLLRFILTTSKIQSTLQTLFDNLLFLHALGLLRLSDKVRQRMTSTKTKMSFISGLLSLWRDLYELTRIVDHETRKAGRRRRNLSEECHVIEEKTINAGLETTSTTRTKRGHRVGGDSIDAGGGGGNDLFHPSLTTISVKDLDWPKFAVFLWRHHFPLCVDAIKSSVDIVVPAKNVGVVRDVNQGFALVCGLVSSICGLMTAWNPAYRLSPS